jgi:hypothetical protein
MNTPVLQTSVLLHLEEMHAVICEQRNGKDTGVGLDKSPIAKCLFDHNESLAIVRQVARDPRGSLYVTGSIAL